MAMSRRSDETSYRPDNHRESKPDDSPDPLTDHEKAEPSYQEIEDKAAPVAWSVGLSVFDLYVLSNLGAVALLFFNLATPIFVHCHDLLK